MKHSSVRGLTCINNLLLRQRASRRTKRLRDTDNRSRYGLSQSDFYQLFAYGHKYLNGTGDLFLIYPQTKSFSKALPPFRFAEGLTLWVVPFDLDRDILVAAPGRLPLRLGGDEIVDSTAKVRFSELSTA